MKLLLTLLSTFALCLFFWNWYDGFKETEIIVENKSGSAIDSIILHINNYTCKFENILPGKSVMTKAPLDSIHLGHDVALIPQVYSKDSSFDANYYYNDLGGIFKKGKFIIDQNFSTRWVILEQ